MLALDNCRRDKPPAEDLEACACGGYVMRAMKYLGLTVAASLVLSGCGAVLLQHTGPMTGFGATLAEWTAHHQQDPRYSGPIGPGTADIAMAYDPDGVSPTGDRYNVVRILDGRVVSYVMRFSSEPIRKARAFVIATLPADATDTGFSVNGRACAFESFTSARLGRALGHTAARDSSGGVLVDYTSGGQGDKYSAGSVDQAIVMTTPSQRAPC